MDIQDLNGRKIIGKFSEYIRAIQICSSKYLDSLADFLTNNRKA